MMSLQEELGAILRRDAKLMQVLTTLRELNLPDWRLMSGAVYQAVWNDRTGRPTGFGVRDYDVGYFDPDTSWDAEDVWIKAVAARFDGALKEQVEVRNQARVHIWFKDHFGEGEDYPALTHTDEALGRFVAPAFAIGVRLEADDSFSVAAPLGLEDMFDLVVRPNPQRGKAKGWEQITAKLLSRWPELKIVE